jgi:GNAT superfamily N-acetyltransferase
MLEDAARGRFPAFDFAVEVVDPPPGPFDVLVGFTGHYVLAGPVTTEEVQAQLPEGDLTAPVRPPFLTWLGQRLGTGAGILDGVLTALGTGRGAESLVSVADLAEHPRAAAASRQRSGVDVYSDAARSGVVTLGRGLVDRWEVSIELDPAARGQGQGRALLADALGLVPSGDAVFAQVSPGNAASLRSFTAAGFSPIGCEILFRRPETPG